jgi:hypothetical protein
MGGFLPIWFPFHCCWDMCWDVVVYHRFFPTGFGGGLLALFTWGRGVLEVIVIFPPRGVFDYLWSITAYPATIICLSCRMEFRLWNSVEAGCGSWAGCGSNISRGVTLHKLFWEEPFIGRSSLNICHTRDCSHSLCFDGPSVLRSWYMYCTQLLLMSVGSAGLVHVLYTSIYWLVVVTSHHNSNSNFDWAACRHRIQACLLSTYFLFPALPQPTTWSFEASEAGVVNHRL